MLLEFSTRRDEDEKHNETETEDEGRRGSTEEEKREMGEWR